VNVADDGESRREWNLRFGHGIVDDLIELLDTHLNIPQGHSPPPSWRPSLTTVRVHNREHLESFPGLTIRG
jgi:hypothetical protein